MLRREIEHCGMALASSSAARAVLPLQLLQHEGAP